MFLFTDGSRLSNSDAESAHGHHRLPNHEVFDAEATAAYEGLKAALNSAQAPYTQHLYVLLDNQEVARQLQGCPRGSSQHTILDFQELANNWPNWPLQCQAIRPGQVHVHWIPGHAGITGNEQADEQAKRGAMSTSQTNSSPARYAWALWTLKEEFWQ
ncbi:hypothetical protein SI65_04140 [Aspergillus cristatus]|uniref:RNase H type-1 domain-containing protein n=1 Tax=Aspergillus cristatus TaxID=573508 RepID=A0A1E3BJK8_ASPCR|nr:hypothetical protein SI65_04140 [Aspergillus cristatus]